jgi:hypothetical protein
MTTIVTRLTVGIITLTIALLFVLATINGKAASTGPENNAMSCPIRAGHCVPYDGP